MGRSLTVQTLREIVLLHKPDVVFLSETHQPDSYLQVIRNQLGFGQSFYISPTVNSAGALCLWWRDDIRLNIISSSKYHIDSSLFGLNCEQGARISWLYGPPYNEDKLEFWEYWKNLARNGGSDGCWLLIGDLNEVLHICEREGGSVWSSYRRNYLRELMDAGSLLDMGYKGQAFTWARKEDNVIVLQERLDRALTNETWILHWPESSLTHLARIGSDHNPLLFSTQAARSKGKPTFHFDVNWAEDGEATQIVKDCWILNPSLSGLSNWVTNLKSCRSSFIRWSKKKFPKCNKDLIRDCLLELDDLQANQAISSTERQQELESSVSTLWIREERYWHQKSRVKWLKSGDSNTRFFHLSTIQRRLRNRILKIQNEQGQWVCGEGLIRKEFESQFKAIFSSGGYRVWGMALSGVTPLVSREMNEELLVDITMDEVSEAVHQMGALKAPGPDGFPGLFYHKYWEIVRDLVCLTSNEFFSGVACLRDLNKTHIVLIPKVPNPEKTSHFRPISLCNNSYKILSKILANRLKRVLPTLISINQNAFVPGRLIQDNILVAHEAYHYLKLKRTGGNHEFGLKLDMNKAYDRVEWDFLEATLHRFGFHRRWIRLVMSCVRSVSFSVVLNGKPGNFFLPSRGLRQGDPLSPYLFLLVSEVLSLRLTRAVNEKQLLGISLSRGCPILSHIFFADDALFFLKGTLNNCSHLSHILSKYCTASGQLINMEKSGIYFSPNTPRQMAFLMCELLSFREALNPGIYLGLPSLWGRSKREAVSYIKERISRKIEGWKEGSLSVAGKEILIKSVALAIPAYPMSCFKLPITTCKEFNSNLSNFWWGSNQNGNKLHWKSWDLLCKPKEAGGMGFRNLEHFNTSLLAKQCWRIIQEPESLWVKVLKGHYFPNSSFFDAKKGYRASWSWSSLLEARDHFVGEGFWQVNNGIGINIWKDCWLPPPEASAVRVIGNIPLDGPSSVASLIDWDTRTWNLNAISHCVHPNDLQRIINIPIGVLDGRDQFIWPGNKNGCYSVRSGYHWLHGRFSSTTNQLAIGSSHCIDLRVWKIIWNIPTLPRIRIFLWKVLLGAAPTMYNLARRRIISSSVCPICGNAEETFEHLLLLCPWVDPIWFGSILGLRIDKQGITTFDRWIIECTQHRSKNEAKYILTVVSFLCWSIWKARCRFVYQGQPLSPIHSSRQASTLVADFLAANAPMGSIGAIASPMQWFPPPMGTFKVNVDASWHPPNRTGISVVIRDSDRRVIAGTSFSCRSSSVIEAEATASLAGIDLAASLEANVVAHAAAMLGKGLVDPLRWASQPPPNLTLVLRNDGLPCPHS
ncbi:hypothetical protein ACLB2K_000612 [Fragaria x ananassa]